MGVFRIWAILLFLVASSATAEQSGELAARRAMNNLAHEFCTCAAYFGIIAQAFRNSNDEKGAKLYDDARDGALKWALIITKMAKLKIETVTARVEISLSAMRKEIDADTSNVSLLFVKHAELCKKLMEDPAKRAEEWIDKQYQ